MTTSLSRFTAILLHSRQWPIVRRQGPLVEGFRSKHSPSKGKSREPVSAPSREKRKQSPTASPPTGPVAIESEKAFNNSKKEEKHDVNSPSAEMVEVAEASTPVSDTLEGKRPQVESLDKGQETEKNVQGSEKRHEISSMQVGEEPFESSNSAAAPKVDSVQTKATKKPSEAISTMSLRLDPSEAPPSFTSLEEARRAFEQASGVQEIAVLKEEVVAASDRHDSATRRVQEMRRQLDENTVRAQEISAQHASMMQNRSSWTDQDVQAFAQLTAAEGKARQLATTSRQAVRQAEDEMQKRLRDYMDALRRRYHEEQLWQDKWRVLGTYWTWSLIALNSVVFLVGQVLHYRREERRLTSIQDMLQGFVRRESLALSGKAEGLLDETSTSQQDSANLAVNSDEEGEKNDASTETTPASILRSHWHDWTRSSGLLLASSGHMVVHEIASLSNSVVAATNRTWDATVRVSRAGVRSVHGTTRFAWQSVCRRARGGAAATASFANDVWSHKLVQKTWKRRDETIKSIHWPSVAFGAIASAFGIVALSLARKR